MGGINGAMDKRDRNTSFRSTVCLFRFSIVTIIFIAKYDFYEITKTSTNFT